MIMGRLYSTLKQLKARANRSKRLGGATVQTDIRRGLERVWIPRFR